jgi:GcrA cell cycle regulator
MLVDLNAKGLTLRQIGVALNAAEPGLTISRNALGAKVTRMGLILPPIVTSWTPDRVERLKELWNEGKSTAQIATELGGISGTAVANKLKRIYKAKAVTRIEIKREARRTLAGRFGGRALHLAAVVQNSAARIAPADGYVARSGAFEPLPGTTPRTLTERPFNGCAWPVGGDGADTLFCCAKKSGQSYCATHSKIALTASAPAKSASEKLWVAPTRRRAA